MSLGMDPGMDPGPVGHHTRMAKAPLDLLGLRTDDDAALLLVALRGDF
jgi:hypothetical protein